MYHIDCLITGPRNVYINVIKYGRYGERLTRVAD